MASAACSECSIIMPVLPISPIRRLCSILCVHCAALWGSHDLPPCAVCASSARCAVVSKRRRLPTLPLQDMRSLVKPVPRCWRCCAACITLAAQSGPSHCASVTHVAAGLVDHALMMSRPSFSLSTLSQYCCSTHGARCADVSFVTPNHATLLVLSLVNTTCVAVCHHRSLTIMSHPSCAAVGAAQLPADRRLLQRRRVAHNRPFSLMYSVLSFCLSSPPALPFVFLNPSQICHILRVQLWALLNFLLPDVFSSAAEFDKWFSVTGDEQQQENVIKKLHTVRVGAPALMHECRGNFLLPAR